MRHFESLVFIQSVFGHELGQESTIHASGNIVPRRN